MRAKEPKLKLASMSGATPGLAAKEKSISSSESAVPLWSPANGLTSLGKGLLQRLGAPVIGTPPQVPIYHHMFSTTRGRIAEPCKGGYHSLETTNKKHVVIQPSVGTKALWNRAIPKGSISDHQAWNTCHIWTANSILSWMKSSLSKWASFCHHRLLNPALLGKPPCKSSCCSCQWSLSGSR